MGNRKRRSQRSSSSSSSTDSSSSSTDKDTGRFKQSARGSTPKKQKNKRQSTSRSQGKRCSGLRRDHGQVENESQRVVSVGDEGQISNTEIEPQRAGSIRSDTDGQRVQQLEEMVRKLVDEKKTKEVVTQVFIRPECIPEFSPGKPNASISKWLNKIDQLAEINQWDERTIIYHMQTRLAGLARTWYENLDSYKYTWAEWKETLARAFPEHIDFPRALKELIKRQKNFGESWTEYYFAKMQLLGQCDIRGKHAVAMLIDGITDYTIQSGAKAGRYETPEDLYREYLSALSAEPRKTDTPQPRWLQFNKSRDLDVKVQHNPNRNGVRCFNCNQVGHTQNKCPKTRLECKHCRRLGHTIETCYKIKQSSS